MWQYIIISFSFLVLIVLSWILQPYLVWRKNSDSQNRQGQRLTIKSTSGTEQTLHEHLEQKKNEKIELSLVVPSYN